MKTRALFGLLGLVVFAASGCATVGRRPGYLIYYDVADAGAVWCWEDHYGWRYLGERQFWWSRTHGPRGEHPPGDDDHKKHPPGDDDRKKHSPGDDDHKKHPPGQPPPGNARTGPGDGHYYPPHPGEKPPWHGQYLFFAADGTVLRSRDGAAFNPVGRLGDDGQIVRQDAPTTYRGSFDSAANSFTVAARPVNESPGWIGALFGSSGGDGGYGGGRYSGNSSGFNGGDRGSYSGGRSYSSNSGDSGGSSYSSGSSGFSNDNSFSNSSSMSSGGGSFSGGGGAGGYSGGSGAMNSGDSNADHSVNKEQ